jgi:hypothetical protein
MSGGTSGGGTARQRFSDDPFEFSAGGDLVHTAGGVGQSSSYSATQEPRQEFRWLERRPVASICSCVGGTWS